MAKKEKEVEKKEISFTVFVSPSWKMTHEAGKIVFESAAGVFPEEKPGLVCVEVTAKEK